MPSLLRVLWEVWYCKKQIPRQHFTAPLLVSHFAVVFILMGELLLREQLSSSMFHGNIYICLLFIGLFLLGIIIVVDPQITDGCANRNHTVLQPANQPIPVQHGRLNCCTTSIFS